MVRKIQIWCWVICFFSCTLQGQSKLLDSLKQMSQSSSQTTQYVDLLNELAFEYLFQSYDTALHFTQEAEKIAQKIAYFEGNAQSLNVRGIVYRMQGNFEKAMENHLEALSICEAKNFQQGIANNYSNIGLIYFDKADYKNSLDYFFKALQIKEKINDQRGIAFSHNDIGKIYEKQGNLREARESYEKALTIWKKLHENQREATTHNSIGKLYLLEKKYDEAMFYLIMAMRTAQKFNDQILISETYNNAGVVYFQKNDFFEAIRWHQQALQTASKIHRKIEIQNAYEGLSKSYQALQKYDSAYLYLQKYIHLKDTLFNQENNRRISSLHFSFELEKKDKEIRTQQLIRNVVLLGTGITLIFLFFLYRANQRRKKINRLLKEQKNEIEQKNTELQQQTEEIATQRDLLATQNAQIIEADQKIKEANEHLQQMNHKLEEFAAKRTTQLRETNRELLHSNQELDLLIYRASHDLKAPLTTFIGLAQLGKMEENRDDQLSIFQRIEFVAHKMAKMLDKLHSISYLNSKEIIIEPIDFEDIILDVRQNLWRIVQKYHPDIRLNVEAIEPAFSDREVLTILLENLVENAIYFRTPAAQTPFIEIEVDSRHTFLEIKVKDDGIGIEETNLDKIFHLFFVGSEISKGNGLGLYVARKAVERLQGKIEVFSELGKFTCFVIMLPKLERTKTD